MKIIQALKIVFGKGSGVNLSYIFLFLIFAIAFIFFFIELQVLLTPEPDNIFLYLKIWRIKDWLIVGLLSILISLNFIFFVYLVKIKNNYPNNRPNKLPESSDRIKTTLIKRPNNGIYPNEGPNNIPEYKPNENQKFGFNSGNLFGPHSGNKNVFGLNSGKNIFIGILGTLSGIFSAILATAFCSSCLVVLFSLLGISFSTGILFLKYKFLIFLLSTILLLISLHFQSKRIIEKCKC
jgi:hypothetical protein